MDIWLGLLAAPTVVLGVQSANYALIQFACASGVAWPPHVVSAAALLFSLLTAWLGWRRWRASAQPAATSLVSNTARAAFLALMAAIIGAFCALVQLMMWVPQWMLGVCR